MSQALPEQLPAAGCERCHRTKITAPPHDTATDMTARFTYSCPCISVRVSPLEAPPVGPTHPAAGPWHLPSAHTTTTTTTTKSSVYTANHHMLPAAVHACP